MEILLLAAHIAAAFASTSSPPAKECSQPATLDTSSLLSTLLQASGYSDSCVAAALDYCSSPQEDGQFASLMEEAKEIVHTMGQMVQTWESRPRNCKDLLDSGDSGKGLRQVYPYTGRPHHRVPVYCDHTVDGGGWTVIQRRSNDTDRQDFYRKWLEYQLGFGDLEGEFWLGLNHLHELTSTVMQELRIDLDDYAGAHRWAKYGYFHVGSSDTNYRLNIGRYAGDAGDSLAYHDGAYFSTHDDDNDSTSSINCAATRRGGWWYKACCHSNLNGYQHVGHYSQSPSDQGIYWEHWRSIGYSLRKTVMMIRPSF